MQMHRLRADTFSIKLDLARALIGPNAINNGALKEFAFFANWSLGLQVTHQSLRLMFATVRDPHSMMRLLERW
eukprot:224611-Pleurochrysis_carterae.AAC.2